MSNRRPECCKPSLEDLHRLDDERPRGADGQNKRRHAAQVGRRSARFGWRGFLWRAALVAVVAVIGEIAAVAAASALHLGLTARLMILCGVVLSVVWSLGRSAV